MPIVLSIAVTLANPHSQQNVRVSANSGVRREGEGEEGNQGERCNEGKELVRVCKSRTSPLDVGK